MRRSDAEFGLALGAVLGGLLMLAGGVLLIVNLTPVMDEGAEGAPLAALGMLLGVTLLGVGASLKRSAWVGRVVGHYAYRPRACAACKHGNARGAKTCARCGKPLG